MTGRWSGEGLTGSEINGRISCQSRHLTSFIILVDYTGVIAEQKVCACDALTVLLCLFVFIFQVMCTVNMCLVCLSEKVMYIHTCHSQCYTYG